MRLAEGLHRLRVLFVYSLEISQGGELVIVLEDILYLQVLPEELNEGFFVGLGGNLLWVGELLLE